MSGEKKIIEKLLDSAGISINGDKPFDIQVHDDLFYKRTMREGSIGFGESYMDGLWDCERLDQFFHKVFSIDLKSKIQKDWDTMVRLAGNVVINAGRKSKAFNIGEKHYDAGNDLYEAMLDKRMTYTGGYWKDANNLDEAQEAKLDLLCKKTGLKPGQTVLDIGSGWGSFLGYAAEKYGVKAVGVTVSKEQKKLADEMYNDLPVETRLQDYRDLSDTFDHIVSVGMIEHVGYKNYRTFMEIAHKSLNDDGLFVLQSIGGNRSIKGSDPWIDKYIFPNSMLPSIAQLGKSIENLFVMEDWHSFGTSYDKTLMAWHSNFENAWDLIKDQYDERFYRMWRFYLLACAGAFRARKIQLWQIVLSKNGVPGGYTAVR